MAKASNALETLKELREPLPEQDFAEGMTDFEKDMYLTCLSTSITTFAQKETLDAVIVKPEYTKQVLHAAHTWAMMSVEMYRKTCRVRKN